MKRNKKIKKKKKKKNYFGVIKLYCVIKIIYIFFLYRIIIVY